MIRFVLNAGLALSAKSRVRMGPAFEDVSEMDSSVLPAGGSGTGQIRGPKAPLEYYPFGPDFVNSLIFTVDQLFFPLL